MTLESLDSVDNREWYKKLKGIIDDEILILKNVNDEYLWDTIDKKCSTYIYRNCLKSPWLNQISLAVLCTTDNKLSPASIHNMMSSLNARLNGIFKSFNLLTTNDFNYTHIHKYLMGEVCVDDSDRQRQAFITHYSSFKFNVSKWIKTRIPLESQDYFSKFSFPEFPFDNRDYGVRNQAIDSAKKKRKDESSAVVSLFSSIRAQCHFRWNQIKRLREITNSVIKKVEEQKLDLPFSFDYEESEHLNERLYFKLDLNSGKEYFLEFIKSTNLLDGSPGEGLWFFDILQNRLLGAWSSLASFERKSEGIAFLEKWGHDVDENIHPFQSRNSGVLTQGFSLTRYQNYNPSRLFINVEPLYIACMFATYAIDIQSYSGARMNEILQVSYDKNCCVITEDKNKKNYIFRLIPKGRDTEENYFMPESVFKSLLMILKELKSHYQSEVCC